MTDRGGVTDRARVFLTALPAFVRPSSIAAYDAASLRDIPNGYVDGGCSFIIIPAGSRAHLDFARDCAGYRGIFDRPLVGWIAGVHLEDLARATAKVVDGRTGRVHADRAVVMHCALAPGKTAHVDILNVFEQGDGDVITFPESGFVARSCAINGRERVFSEYIEETTLDTKLPLVASYCGAMVNVSFREVDARKGEVVFYAPVFEGNEYRLAASIGDYGTEFVRRMSERNERPAFACNCILNYLYAGLEGKKTGDVCGPITFGEIAYMLLNQTLVYLTLRDA